LTAAAAATAEAAEPPIPALIGMPLWIERLTPNLAPAAVSKDCAAARAVLVSAVSGSLSTKSAHRAEPNAGRRLANGRYCVPGRIERLPENVEAHADIADARGRWPLPHPPPSLPRP
jgi:hypothetical protein